MPSDAMQSHYADLLAPVYLWTVGGIESALAQGTSEVRPWADGGGLCVDLGAGFGMHAVPLAREGWEVVAIDASAILLDQLAQFATGLPVRAVCADLRDFAQHLHGRRPRLILCMGDTLTHLAEFTEVQALVDEIAAALAPGGSFVATFRDHTRAPKGSDRFVHVRSDASRILTCFIETVGDRVLVHDVLHEQIDGQWRMRVGTYPKLRLDPEFLAQALRHAGLGVTVEAASRGMVRVQARA